MVREAFIITAKADSDSEVAVKEETKQNIKDVVRENVNEEQK